MAKNKVSVKKVSIPVNKEETITKKKTGKVNLRPTKDESITSVDNKPVENVKRKTMPKEKRVGITILKKQEPSTAENKNSVTRQNDSVKTIEIVKKKQHVIANQFKQFPKQKKNVTHVPSFEEKIIRKIDNIDKTIVELTELKFLLRKYKYEHDVKKKR